MASAVVFLLLPTLLLMGSAIGQAAAVGQKPPPLVAHPVDETPYTIPADAASRVEIASTRAGRFPSVQDRVKLYMSNWYTPPCPGYDTGRRVAYRYVGETNETHWSALWIREPEDRGNNASEYLIESKIEPDKAFFVDRRTLLACATAEGDRGADLDAVLRIEAPKNMRMYCSDVAESLLPAFDHVQWERKLKGDVVRDTVEDPMPPLLLQFGDLRHSHEYRFMDLPHIKKFRSAATDRTEIERVTSPSCIRSRRELMRTAHGHVTLQPIVWKLATSRHFRPMGKVYREDTPWAQKLDMAVFRGQLTGSVDGYDRDLSDAENCYNMRRCRLVYEHANSTLVHARLTSTRNRIPKVLNGVNLMGMSVTIRKLLQFKGIIMLEGNDVASGLKWALLSQSVVLMPEPKHTSWAMEEWLQPWVHYVPLNQNATDVEEKMRWVLDHDDAAQRISERGTLWMQDLVFHPDAAEDDRLVQEEIIRRYASHFTMTDIPEAS